MVDGEQKIEITHDDLKPRKPVVEISNREVAGSRIGKLRGALKDLRERLGSSKTKDVTNGEIKVEILDPVQHRQPSGRVEDQVEILGGAVHSPSEQRRISDEQYDRDLNQIRNRFEGSRWQSPINMDQHFKQEHAGNGDIYTCLPASARNALSALGIKVSESEIVAAIGGRQAFDSQGFTSSENIRRYLASREDVIVDSTNTPMGLVSTLEEGGVVIFGSGAHAQMVSGAEATKEGIDLKIHNPFETTARKVPISEFVRTMKAVEPINRSMITVKRTATRAGN